MDIFKIRNVVYVNMLRYDAIDIKQGAVTFIQGESGSGKSSLLKLLNHSHSYDSGEIVYLGRPITEYDPLLLRQEVSLVAQEVFLVDGNIYDNFKFFYGARGMATPSEGVIAKFLRLACIEISLDKDIQTLSGGERQRVYLAIFMSFAPKVLILDEPTAALDEETSKLLMYNITQYVKEQKLSLIVVSHGKELANIYADEVIYIKKEAMTNA